MVLAKDVMSQDIVTVRPEQTLAEVTRLFTDKSISGAPVVDADGELVGVISSTDLLRSQVGSAPDPYHREGFWIDFRALMNPQPEMSEETTVQEVMSQTSFHVGENTPLHNITNLMKVHGLHRIIVTRGHRQVVGVISSLDLVSHLDEILKADLSV